jgi:hypothetical protein
MAAVGENYFTTSMHLIDRRVPYRFRFDGINLGALSVGKAWYNVGIDIAMTDLETSYYVNFPQIGGLLAEHRGRSLNIAPGCAAVYQPIGGVHMRTSGDITSYAVRIDRAALENQLAARLGRRIHRPLALSLSLNLAHPAGANWARLVRLLATEAAAYRITGRTALTNPLIAAPLHDAVLDGLLQASDHPDRDALEEPVHAWGTAPVHRAIDAMHAHPDHPFTPAGLAQIASCSLRSLQEGFRRYVGLTPMQYLRQIPPRTRPPRPRPRRPHPPQRHRHRLSLGLPPPRQIRHHLPNHLRPIPLSHAPTTSAPPTCKGSALL